MDSIFETQRQTHEEIERYEHALAEVLLQAPTVHRNITRRDRKAAEILDRIVALRESLVRQYEDEPGLRPVELAALTAPPGAKGQGDDLDEFYARFEKIKDFHRQHRNINSRAFINELEELVKGDGMETVYVDDEQEPIIVDTMDSVFSGEEAYGKHLDLYYAHSLYLNLDGTGLMSYIAYIDMLRHGKLERTLETKDKASPSYLNYVQTLYDYLVGFFNRALPLINIQAKLKEEEENFATAWEAGQVSGWEEKKKAAPAAPAGEAIWCGYCQKHYSKQTVYDAHLKSAKHQKKEQAGNPVPDPATTNGSPAPVATSSSSSRDKLRPAARLTYLVTALLAFPPIPQILLDSRSEVERRMALTAREREAELERNEEAAPPPPEINPQDEEEEEDDGKIYNPLKLPLGWDGKPIPFWLYKLHGLGVEFRCEICSDAAYQGRKAFDKHFQENKHTFGMRALGLPNTKHFHGITKIADALALAEKLKREGREEMAHLAKAEEVEDSEGNVYSRATYEALKKQGVL